MADAEAEVALAAIEDGDGVEGVQLYVCGSDGELELLALEDKAGGRRWTSGQRPAACQRRSCPSVCAKDSPRA